MPPPGPPLPFTEPFIKTLEEAASINFQDDPKWYASEPRCLISESTVNSFVTGTGDAVYRSLIPLLEATNHELILVTCFWARSSTLDSLNALLRKLSEKAIRRGNGKITVRLCFSSSSLFQKLFHKQSLRGQTYPKASWTKQFGLPDPSELEGLELHIKSIFILPFSVMHPKFILIDRQTVVLPSCNISWEEWFEGAITFSGPIVENFFQFYKRFWCRTENLRGLPAPASDSDYPNPQDADATATQDLQPNAPHGHTVTHISTASPSIPTVFLPSPHRRNPRFQPFASSSAVSAPPTPLNVFILNLLAQAARTIRIQSPNLTAPPVLSAILKALKRGVDVQILTSERLMILEQLVTAGTTTARCVKTLIKRYKKLAGSTAAQPTDEEAALSAPRIGVLRIAYFEPLNGSKARGKEEGEPQQSHLKMMIVDGEVVVLGSGNLDRASWFTSQELGVAFFDRGLVGQVEEAVNRGMRGRERLVFDGSKLVGRPTNRI
ncbi:phospholipase D/nuclease [Karstenula rhodostoma CBS 690.94]|uniref:Phospholipase D/nuclease n=1 Tax=Karstenula rhodostoma CBS 690.94 TaxID=1392251 RepID=A0A9P4PTU4_9PLEO|nr:phospholipase D/nuclease [Karstenula rhodostoma CBS 690.94]